MARDHARIKVSIWADPDFRALRAPLQHAYLMLTSQPRVSYCGVLEYLPRRYASMAAGLTVESIEKAIVGLVEKRFVVLDEDTEELLIRSYVRHDELLKMANPAKAMAKDYAQVLSQGLRAAILTELRRAYFESPQMKGWQGIADASPELFQDIAREAFSNGTPNPNRNGTPNRTDEADANPNRNPG